MPTRYLMLQASHHSRTANQVPLHPALENNPRTIKTAETRKQTERILYIIPKFRAISADQELPPQAVQEKFKTATLDSVDYSSFIFVAIQSGMAQARNATPEFHHEFLFPADLRQDSRFYTLGRGGFSKRLAYSFSRIAITRTDSGHAAAGISSLYYPSQERTFTKTYQLWITNIAIDGGTFIFKEFWPDINNKFFHQKD
jgi:hypothetical protein